MMKYTNQFLIEHKFKHIFFIHTINKNSEFTSLKFKPIELKHEINIQHEVL